MTSDATTKRPIADGAGKRAGKGTSGPYRPARRLHWLGALTAVWAVPAVPAEEMEILPRMAHLRAGGEVRQWDDFPEKAEGERLELEFKARANATDQTLWLRQAQVRHQWQVTLNGQIFARLSRDERDQTIAWPVPAGALREGSNVLVVEAPRAPSSDDILVGEIRLDSRRPDEVLGEARVEVAVSDADSGAALPCRITVVDAAGSLVSLGAVSDDRLAVRPGTVYTLDGNAAFGLPPGEYTVYAGRGAEYSLARGSLVLAPGDRETLRLAIRHEVVLPGYVASDPHLHTLTHSGHGDATLTERLVTIAGEGFGLPIATDHDVSVDYREEAARIGADPFFTPVIGNEVTTGAGHFLVFPVEDVAAPMPDSGILEWPELFKAIRAVPGVRAVILAHGRDEHRGFVPLGPARFLAASGRRLDGRVLEANAMEVINSGATRSDPMEYLKDWMAMMNRGQQITPVGSSDSHDVVRKFAAQARTYIRAGDRDPGALDVAGAVESFVAGRVLVSFGLVADLLVGTEGGPGDTVRADGKLEVAVRVLGPSWLEAERVILFANGVPVREAVLEPASRSEGGEKWTGTWTLEAPSQDLHLVAVALGPGIEKPYWTVSRPYQATGSAWSPYVLGLSGAVRVDADGDGRWTSPREHAQRLLEAAGDDLPRFFGALSDYDVATAIQGACLLDERGISPEHPALESALAAAVPELREAFAEFEASWRTSREAPPAEDPARRALLRDRMKGR